MKQGDVIHFRILPWLFPDKAVYEGIVAEIIDNGNERYYYVNAFVGDEYVEEGLVLDSEIIKE